MSLVSAEDRGIMTKEKTVQNKCAAVMQLDVVSNGIM